MIVYSKDGNTADCDIPPEALWLLHQVHEEAGEWLYTRVTIRIEGIPRIVDLEQIDIRRSIEHVILENERDTEPARSGSTMPCPTLPPSSPYIPEF